MADHQMSRPEAEQSLQRLRGMLESGGNPDKLDVGYIQQAIGRVEARLAVLAADSR